MSWTAPRTWVAGETVTASLGNTHWRDNLTELRAGGIAIASQAAQDFLRASSATQLARLAAVSSRTPRYNGSAWEMFNMASVAASAWPVGSVFEAVVSTNPATLLGFGTWTAFGTGRCVVGIDAGQTEFDTVEETGGAKTVTLSTSELPSHTHVQDAHTHTQNSHNHTQNAHAHTISGMGDSNLVGNLVADVTVMDDTGGTKTSSSVTATNVAATATNQSTTATNQNAGGGGAHNNLMPYIVVYRWKRTA